jgi:hypothetical protein
MRKDSAVEREARRREREREREQGREFSDMLRAKYEEGRFKPEGLFEKLSEGESKEH